MPVSYEPLNVNTDVTNTKTILHEVIPLTGTIVSGTYSDENIKNYTHGMFQSVYDYPYLSSSANHIFDISVAYDESSTLSASSNVQNNKKINMYNQFAQVLLGYTGSNNTVRLFENDLLLDNVGVMKNVFVVSFSRLLTKDQVKKGTFSLELGRGAWPTAHSTTITLQDVKASTSGDGTLSTIGGDYGVLYDSTASATNAANTSSYGVIFYQAGIAILSSSIFDNANVAGYGQFSSGSYLSGAAGNVTTLGCTASIATSSISGTCDALRHRITNLTFNNSTEINSTIYFCRLPVNKFNYSSNPTYTSGSKIRVKDNASDLPVAYASTVGLYNAQNELLAVAKLSEPLKKTPQNELTIRVRLDY
tara:strand:- start:296 stop:1384 length:1089 start_codon:yes stop_codon:yes gene_type:complete